MASPVLPRQQSNILDNSGRPTREWYDFFRDLLDNVAGDGNVADEIAALGNAITALEAEFNRFGSIRGVDSVIVNGDIATGPVFVSLLGDSSIPGADKYYGTNANGTNGFYPLTYRGVLPMVTGEVPPVLLYADDGSLIYAPVEA